MDKQLLATIREALQKRSRELTRRLSEGDASLKQMNDTLQPEREELAQREQLSGITQSLNDRDQAELADIDAALAQMNAGTYGVCQSCGRRIEEDRLRTNPTTQLCAECSIARERETLPESTDEPAASAELPPDLDIMSDDELSEHLLELVRDSGQVDTDELRIVPRNGVIHLEGAIPSEAEHEVLVNILTDVAGVREIVDRLEIQRLAWEREDRSKAQSADDYRPGTVRRAEPNAGTEDPILTEDEGVNYDPPVNPPTPFNRTK